MQSSSLLRTSARLFSPLNPKKKGFYSNAITTLHKYPNSISFRQLAYYTYDNRKLPKNLIIRIVPQGELWVVERFGKFNKILEPGLHFLLPILDKIRYVHTNKEVATEILNQSAITEDNVTLHIDGVLYTKVLDPYRASYGVEDPEFAIQQIAKTTMRSEIGRRSLDKTFAERETLNASIVEAINKAGDNWGIRCMRYEIRDIQPPKSVLISMELQVSAERKKRAQILESQGEQMSAVNVAQGKKLSTVLNSEGLKTEQINRAKGEAEAILVTAKATAEGIERLSRAIQSRNGRDAVNLWVAQKYVDAFAKLAKKSNTLILPSNTGDVGSMVAQALTIYKNINQNTGTNNESTAPEDTIEDTQSSDNQGILNSEPESSDELIKSLNNVDLLRSGKLKQSNQDDLMSVDSIFEKLQNK